jgi:hypothetical protein
VIEAKRHNNPNKEDRYQDLKKLSVVLKAAVDLNSKGSHENAKAIGIQSMVRIT